MRSDEPLQKIRDYWERSAGAERDAQGQRPTARDPWLQEVVEAIMEARIPGGAALLDVGCGDGWSTLRFARRASRAVGVDFVARYVERARDEAARRGAARVSFMQGDAMDLSPARAQHGRFDVVTSIRCLINLAAWGNQARALGEIAQCVAPGGLYLASEGWAEGMQGLNLRRERAGLAPIQVAEFNRLMSRSDFEAEARRWFDVVGYESAGLYLYLSRVAQPLLMAPEPPRHDHPLNRVAAALQSASPGSPEFQDCDYAGVYVLRRRAG